MNTLQELQTMIAGACASNPEPKARRKALMACQWRLVDADGRSISLQTVNGIPYQPAWCHADEGIVFDGRDNEAHKLAFFERCMGTKLFVSILPQITCAAA